MSWGFTNRSTITEILENCTSQQPTGKFLNAGKQPAIFCGCRNAEIHRAHFKKAPFLQIVPMLASVGCPYTCSFCIDSTVPYQPLDFETIKTDLQFLLTKYKKPWIAFHDPNFGVRFEDNMEAIASAGAPKSFHFIAESSLSILTTQRLDRLKQNGFFALLPGVESWYDLGNKSGSSHISGMEKVNRVSNHVNTILGYVPYVQTNFMLGLTVMPGVNHLSLPNDLLTKRPALFPAFLYLPLLAKLRP